ncbi:MAG: 2-C-methyl-D-erythritol 4-phosphate cytidylyltransferase [Firmicutes bacterium]|nr:2-C-methyl-D-erythritol 4-phosphate cytidylyltransferase [Bacillota bacterium]
MKYVIMADGKGTRWNNYQNIPKHFIEVGGETLLARTVRLLHEKDQGCQVFITSHDPRYDIEGATRYEPQNNVLEIDRFTRELIEDDVCFLYGDTYYSDDAMEKIVTLEAEDLLFFGNEKSIVAVKVKDAALFTQHLDNVTRLFLAEKIKGCKGWQVYQSFTGLAFDVKQIGEKYIYIEDGTKDYNAPEDLDMGKDIG